MKTAVLTPVATAGDLPAREAAARGIEPETPQMMLRRRLRLRDKRDAIGLSAAFAAAYQAMDVAVLCIRNGATDEVPESISRFVDFAIFARVEPLYLFDHHRMGDRSYGVARELVVAEVAKRAVRS